MDAKAVFQMKSRQFLQVSVLNDLLFHQAWVGARSPHRRNAQAMTGAALDLAFPSLALSGLALSSLGLATPAMAQVPPGPAVQVPATQRSQAVPTRPQLEAPELTRILGAVTVVKPGEQPIAGVYGIRDQANQLLHAAGYVAFHRFPWVLSGTTPTVRIRIDCNEHAPRQLWKAH